jgi:1-acyl-sn-glycerol-3-phosphate acyltransferase
MPNPVDATDPTRWAPLWRGLRALRAAFTVGLYLVIAPSGCLPFAIVCLLWRGDPEGRTRILQQLSARGLRVMHWWLRHFRIIDFDWRRQQLGLPPGPCVVIANHPTQLDPTAILATLVHAVTLVKPSVYRKRLLRPLLQGAMHLEGPSMDPMSIAHVIANASERLRLGNHLFVFPEGTRSPEGGLGEFGRIAFEIACRAKVPLVSVALRCEPCYLSRETPLLRPPARLPKLQMRKLAIDLPGDFGNDSRLLREKVEQRYRAWVAAGMPALPVGEATRSAATASATNDHHPSQPDG